MQRSFWTGLLGVVCLGWAAGTPVVADQDWIRAGSYLDWPEILTSTEPLVPEWIAERTVPVSHTEFADHAEPAAFAELDDIDFEPAPQPLPIETVSGMSVVTSEEYTWQLIPQGLLYHSYLAGEKEPRMASQWLWGYEDGQHWDMVLGGRFGLLRHGTQGWDAEGFQIDMEGAAMGRINPNMDSDPFEASDWRAGFNFTWRRAQWRWKLAYTHVSSHAGDEYIINNPSFVRINYVRDSVMAGLTYDFTPNFQGYGEVGYALGASGGAEPIELQFGLQYSPAAPTGFRGAPFAAINGHLRQEFNFGGSVNAEAGWAWRNADSGHLLRFGVQHYNGMSLQWEFYDRYESLTGIGLWYDF